MIPVYLEQSPVDRRRIMQFSKPHVLNNIDLVIIGRLEL